MNSLLHITHDRLWRNGSAKLKEPIRNKVLRQRKVKVWLSGRRYEEVLSVSRDTDDFNERSRVTLQTKILSYGIFVRPETFRHGLVHDRNRLRLFAIRVCELPSLHEWDLHRFEVRRANAIIRDHRRPLARGHGMPLYKNRSCFTWEPHGHCEGETCVLHPRYSPNFVYQLLVKGLRLRLIVANFMGIHDDIQYLIGIESEIHMLGRMETPNKKSRSNQQH